MKESIVFYKSFYEAIKELSGDVQLQLYTAIFEKYFFENDVELKGVAKGIFSIIKPNIDSANRRYFANVENGKKGGAPKGNQNAKKTTENNPIQPKNNPKTSENNLNDNVNDNVNVNVNDNVNYNINNTLDKKNNINNISIVHSSNARECFEKLWSLYPKKVGKKKSFDKYLKIHSLVSDEEIENGIKKYVEHINKEKKELRYVKDGSTWFNQECWKDEYENELDKNNIKTQYYDDGRIHRDWRSNEN